MSTIRQPLPDALAADMAALMEAVAAETGPLPDPTLLAPGEGRALSERLNRRWNVDLPAMAATAEVTLPADPNLGSAAVRMRVLVPDGAAAGALLFVHGGGFAFCSPESHERCARVLAVESGLAVLVPDYRLAPEHPFPAGLKDVVASLRAGVAASAPAGVRPGPLVVAGDSAGANLALAAILAEQAAGNPAPAGALLLYGVYGADFETPSYRQFADGPGLTRGKMQRYWDWYVADTAARADPLVAPLAASDTALAALPPLHLMAAGIDPLLSDTLALTQRLAALGRPETVRVVPGVVHGFLQMTVALDQARAALAAAGAAAREMIAAG